MPAQLAPLFYNDYLPAYSDKYPYLNGFWHLYGLGLIEADFGLEEANGELEGEIFDVIFV